MNIIASPNKPDSQSGSESTLCHSKANRLYLVVVYRIYQLPSQTVVTLCCQTRGSECAEGLWNGGGPFYL